LISKGAELNPRSGEDWTPLHEAVVKGNKDVASLLIDKGADLNAKLISGRTALHLAFISGHSEIAELLIANGADVTARDNEGNSPFDLKPCKADKSGKRDGPVGKGFLDGKDLGSDLK